MQSRTVPSVSVVMPVYNAENYLKEAIDSILNQSFTDFEFIIINDGSTDRSQEIIKSYSDCRIKYLENEKNSGICVTLNKGLDAARGRYIARMDADDIAVPERLALQVEYMDSHPEIGVVGSDIQIFYSNDEDSQIFNFDTDPLTCKANLIFSATLAHPTAFIRKSVLDDHNLRYDDYYSGMEDHHLWWEISKYSDISNISEVLLRYRQHASQVTKKDVTEEFKERLRAFITHRLCDCGVILDTNEIYSFCLYLENNDSFDDSSLKSFISACHKILKRLKEKRVKHYKAQKIVFSRAISFSLDKSGFDNSSSVKYQIAAFFHGAMDFYWLSKRIANLLLKRGG